MYSISKYYTAIGTHMSRKFIKLDHVEVTYPYNKNFYMYLKVIDENSMIYRYKSNIIKIQTLIKKIKMLLFSKNFFFVLNEKCIENLQ